MDYFLILLIIKLIILKTNIFNMCSENTFSSDQFEVFQDILSLSQHVKKNLPTCNSATFRVNPSSTTFGLLPFEFAA